MLLRVAGVIIFDVSKDRTTFIYCATSFVLGLLVPEDLETWGTGTPRTQRDMTRNSNVTLVGLRCSPFWSVSTSEQEHPAHVKTGQNFLPRSGPRFLLADWQHSRSVWLCSIGHSAASAHCQLTACFRKTVI